MNAPQECVDLSDADQGRQGLDPQLGSIAHRRSPNWIRRSTCVCQIL